MASKRMKCTVLSNRPMTPTVFEVRFRPSETLEFRAGQFVSVVIPGAGPKGRDLRRAYSVASPPEFDHLELCVKKVEGGPGTTFLASLKEGDEFEIVAPYGDFVYQTEPSRDVFFIATGTGVAPFRAMKLSDEYKNNSPRHTTVLFGVTTKDEILYEADFKEGVNWVCCLSRNLDEAWTGQKGRVTTYLDSLPSNFKWSETDFYLCGNGQMITDVKKFLAEKGVDKKQIHQEIYYR